MINKTTRSLMAPLIIDIPQEDIGYNLAKLAEFRRKQHLIEQKEKS